MFCWGFVVTFQKGNSLIVFYKIMKNVTNIVYTKLIYTRNLSNGALRYQGVNGGLGREPRRPLGLKQA